MLRLFQHTAARRRLLPPSGGGKVKKCFNTQPPEGGCHYVGLIIRSDTVSTHSRPKAAVGSLLVVGQAWAPFQHTAARRRLESNKFRKENVMSFNTQPPEGGWP